jgi:hypothetical protein
MTRCRDRGILIPAGGLSYSNLGAFAGWATATPANQEFHDAIISASQKTDVGSSHF